MADTGDEGAPASAEAGRHPGHTLVWPVRAIHLAARWILIAAMTIILVFTVAQVVDRYLLKSAFNAHDQFARLGMVLLTFAGIAVAIRDRVNLRIEVVAHFVSPAASDRISLLLEAVTLALALAIAIIGWRLLDIGASQPIMGTPFTYRAMYIELIVGMATLVLFLVLRFAGRLFRARARLDVADDDHRA